MIGVFDSGFGGLTILKAFLKKLPRYDYIYLGDNARAPYGNKSEEVIYNYTREAVDFLFKKGCSLIIVACNSASAKALRKIQQEYLPKNYPDKRVLGVIIPVAEEAALQKFKKVGIIGTKLTVESKGYITEIRKLNKKIKIYQQPCPLLVPLIEEGWKNKQDVNSILRAYLLSLKKKKIEALMLGCTHYPILKKEIQKIIGSNVKIIDPTSIVAMKLQDYLKRHPEIEEKLEKTGKRTFFTTDDTKRFKVLGEKYLGKKILSIEKINLM